jgi:hypothetical protein
MTHKVHIEDKQKDMKVAKDALSKLLLHLQKLKANIAKQEVQWDSLQDYNESAITPSKGVSIRDAIKASKSKNSELITTL